MLKTVQLEAVHPLLTKKDLPEIKEKIQHNRFLQRIHKKRSFNVIHIYGIHGILGGSKM